MNIKRSLTSLELDEQQGDEHLENWSAEINITANENAHKEMKLENTAASEIETKLKLWHENLESTPVEIFEAADANNTGMWSLEDQLTKNFQVRNFQIGKRPSTTPPPPDQRRVPHRHIGQAQWCLRFTLRW